jgi:hypothetical protein
VASALGSVGAVLAFADGFDYLFDNIVGPATSYDPRTPRFAFPEEFRRGLLLVRAELLPALPAFRT